MSEGAGAFFQGQREQSRLPQNAPLVVTESVYLDAGQQRVLVDVPAGKDVVVYLPPVQASIGCRFFIKLRTLGAAGSCTVQHAGDAGHALGLTLRLAGDYTVVDNAGGEVWFEAKTNAVRQ